MRHMLLLAVLAALAGIAGAQQPGATSGHTARPQARAATPHHIFVLPERVEWKPAPAILAVIIAFSPSARCHLTPRFSGPARRRSPNARTRVCAGSAATASWAASRRTCRYGSSVAAFGGHAPILCRNATILPR